MIEVLTNMRWAQRLSSEEQLLGTHWAWAWLTPAAVGPWASYLTSLCWISLLSHGPVRPKRVNMCRGAQTSACWC